MPWSEIAPGRFQPAIGENELFIKMIGDSGHALGRELWGINSIASFALTGSLADEDIPSLFIKAWKTLRPLLLHVTYLQCQDDRTTPFLHLKNSSKR